MNVLGILAFVVALLLSVMLHEAGHFLTARRFGMKATQFFVGFGPTLFSRTKGETEYGVKAIPAGGFVKIVGMTPVEEVEPGDEDRAFYKQRALPKTIVLAAGSTVHFAICVVLIFITLIGFGVPDSTSPVLGRPADCLALSITSTTTPPSSVKDPKTGCAEGTVPGIAAAAGVRSGDKVLRVNGQQVETYKEFQRLIRSSPGKDLEVVVERDGGTATLHLTPALTTRPDLDEPAKTEKVGAIGVIAGPTTLERVGLGTAISETGTTLKLLVVGTWESLTKKLHTITKVYDEDRDPAGFVGVVGVSRVSGEVFEQPDPWSLRIVSFLLLVAGLNLFVGIFNLLPLLPLDGGHIAVVWFEAVRDRIRRARGYVGEIQRVDYNKLMPVTFAVVVLFAGFTLWLLGADIVNPIRISQ